MIFNCSSRRGYNDNIKNNNKTKQKNETCENCVYCTVLVGSLIESLNNPDDTMKYFSISPPSSLEKPPFMKEERDLIREWFGSMCLCESRHFLLLN